jgi:hypothetical protein
VPRAPNLHSAVSACCARTEAPNPDLTERMPARPRAAGVVGRSSNFSSPGLGTRRDGKRHARTGRVGLFTLPDHRTPYGGSSAGASANGERGGAPLKNPTWSSHSSRSVVGVGGRCVTLCRCNLDLLRRDADAGRPHHAPFSRQAMAILRRPVGARPNDTCAICSSTAGAQMAGAGGA